MHKERCLSKEPYNKEFLPKKLDQYLKLFQLLPGTVSIKAMRQLTP